MADAQRQLFQALGLLTMQLVADDRGLVLWYSMQLN
jgi:hypothetical protein